MGFWLCLTSTVIFVTLHLAVVLPILCIYSDHKGNSGNTLGFRYRIVIHSLNLYLIHKKPPWPGIRERKSESYRVSALCLHHKLQEAGGKLFCCCLHRLSVGRLTGQASTSLEFFFLTQLWTFVLFFLQEDMQQLILMPLPNVAILGQDPLTGTR